MRPHLCRESREKNLTGAAVSGIEPYHRIVRLGVPPRPCVLQGRNGRLSTACAERKLLPAHCLNLHMDLLSPVVSAGRCGHRLVRAEAPRWKDA